MNSLLWKTQDLLSSEVLLPFSRIQRMIRPSRRQITKTYYEGLRFRAHSASWSEERRHEWILNRLRHTVRRAYQGTHYYKELFARIDFDPSKEFSFEDFARIPVLERDDIQEAGKNMFSSEVPVEQLQRDATGGSTGVPLEIWLGPEEIGWRDSAGERFKILVGAPEGTRTGLFWGHHLDPVASDRWRDRYHTFVSNTRWFDCFRLSPEVLEKYHLEFERWHPKCIIAYASALASLAAHIKEQGYTPTYPDTGFVTGAEKLFAEQRSLIEEVFRRPIHERYGSRDVGFIALQTNPKLSLHFDVDWANLLVEPEHNGKESEILITKLHADGMPMLRYRIGDIAIFPGGSRPGTPTFSLHEVVGRTTDRVWLRNGGWINGIQLPHLLKDFPVQEFMLTQQCDYSVELKIVPCSRFSNEDHRSIRVTLAANLPDLDLSVTLVDQIPRTKANKWRPVVSHVKCDKGAQG